MAEAERWLAVLEDLGLDRVKDTLDQNRAAGQAAAIWIGDVQMTKGYAEEWYWHHAAQKARRQRLWKGAKAVGSFALSVATHWLALVAVATAIVSLFGSKLMRLW